MGRKYFQATVVKFKDDVEVTHNSSTNYNYQQ